ncbi:hypothetical protein DKX38_011844 [Salix brachista]|uniref:FAR1 domain-containing protein n=1 Tax=Salix brachista TaxID=2182728 RepID=A0A5N5M0J4_9ROSI|nr:hypothetical protein DKX38_011844 [Salix brachista]
MSETQNPVNLTQTQSLARETRVRKNSHAGNIMTSTTDGRSFLDSDGGSDEEVFESLGEHEASQDGLLQQCISQCVVDNDMILTESSMENLSVDGLEPYTGMAFPSLDDARDFYYEYAKQTGFTIRTNRIRHSLKNMAVIGRDFVCSREGFRAAKHSLRKDRALPPRPVTREGCKAMIRMAARDGGKWVVTKFVKDHNHKLMTHCKFLGELPTINILSENLSLDFSIRVFVPESSLFYCCGWGLSGNFISNPSILGWENEYIIVTLLFHGNHWIYGFCDPYTRVLIIDFVNGRSMIRTRVIGNDSSCHFEVKLMDKAIPLCMGCEISLIEEKDKKIQDLYHELQRERERSAAFQQQLCMIIKDIKEHEEFMSLRVEDIVKTLKEIELCDS